MLQAADNITISVPRHVLSGIVQLSAELIDHMHALLEKNTDGSLSASERAELETLVRMAEFSQMVSVALEPQDVP